MPASETNRQIFDVQGRLLKTGKFDHATNDQITLELSGTTPGVLLVQLTNARGRWQEKVVKQ